MCTQENIDEAINLGLYDKKFEVDENKQFDPKLLIRPFSRSNQGKQITVLRSEKGMIKSVNRLHFIFNKHKHEVDIFSYITDRFRSITMELKQIESKNNDVLHFRIPYLESQIRIYLILLFEMMKADPYNNKQNCKKLIFESLDDLFMDYQTQLSENMPEFVQYHILLQSASLPSPEAYYKIISILNTKYVQFSDSILECQITRNYQKIYSLSKAQESVFVKIVLLVIQEQNVQLIESKKYSSGLIGQVKIEFLNFDSVYAELQAYENILPLINKKDNCFGKLGF